MLFLESFRPWPNAHGPSRRASDGQGKNETKDSESEEKERAHATRVERKEKKKFRVILAVQVCLSFFPFHPTAWVSPETRNGP